MVKKAPRRTAERILEAALDLFNRYGEPNVSTTLIAAELRISPGNLYYHYPSKEALIGALAGQYGQQLQAQLAQGGQTPSLEQVEVFFHALCSLTWDYRFLHRNLADLLANSRQLEGTLQNALGQMRAAMRSMLVQCAQSGALRLQADDLGPTTDALVLVLTYWLCMEYLEDPRNAFEPAAAPQAIARGTQKALQVLSPYRNGLPDTAPMHLAVAHVPQAQTAIGM